MGNEAKFYIDGRWVDPLQPEGHIVVVDPSTEEKVARVAKASKADVDAAVQAAHRALASYSLTSRQERYSPAHAGARGLYASLGFIETGEMEDDELVARRPL